MFVYTLRDIIFGVFLASAITIAGALMLIQYIKQSMCKHDGGVNETMACEAICRKCGKNLGFIGTWYEKQKRGEDNVRN